jgi:glycosyltransferase involved in cell wall biosynthesis
LRLFLAATSLAPQYGGPAVSVSSLALALVAGGIEVGLWTSDGTVAATALLPAEGPKGLTCLSGPASEALDRFAPDIVHDNGLWLAHNHRLAMISAQRGLARIVSTRGMLEPWARCHKKWKKDIAWTFYQRRDLARASALHATAEKEAENLANLKLGVPIQTIPNGVDIPEISLWDNRPPASVRTAAFLGRLYPVKGLPLLIKAWHRVRPDGWRLLLAGPDEAGHRSELEALTEQFGLSDTISFVGPLAGAAKSQFLAEANLFILPSFTESFGIAVAEALAHAVPVLTTDATPWPMLRRRGCGWTVPATIDGVAEGLKEATCHDTETLAAKGAVGRTWVAAEFGWQRVAQRFIAAYQETLVRRPC